MRHRGLPKLGCQFTLAMVARNLVRPLKMLAAPTQCFLAHFARTARMPPGATPPFRRPWALDLMFSC